MNHASFVCLVWRINQCSAVNRIEINTYLILGETQHAALQNPNKDLIDCFTIMRADAFLVEPADSTGLLWCMDFLWMMGIMMMMDALVFIFVPERWPTAGSHMCRCWPLKTTSSYSTCKYPQATDAPFLPSTYPDSSRSHCCIKFSYFA